jgi:hypothetical protein
VVNLKKIVIYFVLPFLLILTAGLNVKASEPFTDLGPVPWAEEEISFLYERGVIVGYGNGRFAPNDLITREQAALILVKELYPLETSATRLNFSDVHENSIYYNAIAVAVDHGKLVGYPDGTFKPHNPITRAESARIISSAYDLTGTNADFTDVSQAHWAIDYINALASNQIVVGYPDHTFRPNNSITRAEFSVLFARVLDDRFKDEPVDEDRELVVTIDNSKNSIVVNGISLGISKEEVINKLGNPKVRDNQKEDYFLYSLKNSYNQLETELYVQFHNNKVASISFDINNHVINANWYRDLGQPFAVKGGVTYYYLEGAEQILMIKPSESRAYVGHADNNFYFYFGMEDKME